jgi:hypothetical protein
MIVLYKKCAKCKRETKEYMLKYIKDPITKKHIPICIDCLIPLKRGFKIKT